MIPPLVRRCPECDHLGLSRSFSAAGGSADPRVECPRCGHRFRTTDRPTLN